MLYFRLFGWLFFFISEFSYAQNYSANMENSKWTLSKSTKLKCELSHNIPNYGTVRFFSVAGKINNLNLNIEPLRTLNTTTKAAIHSVPPLLKAGYSSHKLGVLELFRQHNIYANNSLSWSIASSLEQGNFPTFYYSTDNKQHITVSINPIHFSKSYENFSECYSNLLPFSFDDIKLSILNFNKNSLKLNKLSKNKLNQIKQYLKEYSQLEKIFIDSYSDSYGGRHLNMTLTEKRANKIKNSLIKIGIDEDLITIRSHGEKRHVSSNETEIGRSQNRRVVVSLVI